MPVRESSSVMLPVPAREVLPWVADLSRYPRWMPLVHGVVAVSEGVWDVELRARVGPLARSKRLRMRRTTDLPTTVRFERDEVDGRLHAPWVLEVTIDDAGSSCTVRMDLAYGGSLWTAGVLDRVLAHHIEMGKEGLARAVGGPSEDRGAG